MSNKVNFVNIPTELKQNASFCVWKLEKRQGRPTKVPYNPKTASSPEPMIRPHLLISERL
jgi:primase-polymerase (primpol)-like protein